MTTTRWETGAKNPITCLLCILIAACIIRLALPATAIFATRDLSVFAAVDTDGYVKPAESLLKTGKFSKNGAPDVRRTPGYPLLLIPGILLGNVELITIFLQIIISCLTIYLVYKISFLLFGKPEYAVSASILYMLEPQSILYASKLYSETLFTCVLMLFFYCLIAYLNDRPLKYLLASSLFLAATAYIRPINYYLPPFITAVLLGLTLFGEAPKTRKKSAQFFHILIFFVVSMGLIGVWQARNKIAADYSGFSTVSDINMYFYQAASVLSAKEKVPYMEMRTRMGYWDREKYFAGHPEQRAWRKEKTYKYMGREGTKIVLDNPRLYARIHIKGILRTFMDPGASEYFRMFKSYDGGFLNNILDRGLANTIKKLFTERPAMFFVSVALSMLLALYYLLAAMSFFTTNTLMNQSFILMISVIFYLAVISGGPVGYARFRQPMMPFVCVMGGYGFFVIARLFGRNRMSGVRR